MGGGAWPCRCLRQSPQSLPMVPKEPTSGTGRPPCQKPVGHAASTDSCSRKRGSISDPAGVDRHVTRPAPGVRSSLQHHQPSCKEMSKRAESPLVQPAQMLWRSPSLHHCHGKTGCVRGGRRAREALLYWRRFPALSISCMYGGL